MGRAIVLSSTRIAILIIAASLVGYFAGTLRSTAKTLSIGNDAISVNSHNDGDNDGGTFVLLVNMKFASLSRRDDFLDMIKPVCEDVRENEGPHSSSGDGVSTTKKTSTTTTGTTLSYKVAISDGDPLKVVVIERYTDKDHGFLEVHRSGKEFLKFRKRLKSMQESGDVTIDGDSYLETDLGYV